MSRNYWTNISFRIHTHTRLNQLDLNRRYPFLLFFLDISYTLALISHRLKVYTIPKLSWTYAMELRCSTWQASFPAVQHPNMPLTIPFYLTKYSTIPQSTYNKWVKINSFISFKYTSSGASGCQPSWSYFSGINQRYYFEDTQCSRSDRQNIL